MPSRSTAAALRLVPPPAPRPEPKVVSIWRGAQDAVNALARREASDTFSPVDGPLAGRVVRVAVRNTSAGQIHTAWSRGQGDPVWSKTQVSALVEGYAADSLLWTWLRSQGLRRRGSR
jgi:hypothetical protein